MTTEAMWLDRNIIQEVDNNADLFERLADDRLNFPAVRAPHTDGPVVRLAREIFADRIPSDALHHARVATQNCRLLCNHHQYIHVGCAERQNNDNKCLISA